MRHLILSDFDSVYGANTPAVTEFLNTADAGSALVFYTTVEMIKPPPPTREQIAKAQAEQLALAQQRRQQQLMQGGDDGSGDSDAAVADALAGGETGDASPESGGDGAESAAAAAAAKAAEEDAATAAAVEAAMLSLAQDPVPVVKLHLATQLHLPEADASVAATASRSMYLLKNVDKVIAPIGNETPAAAMARAVEYGVLPGQSLMMLERVIKSVYLPIFEPEQVCC